MGIFTCYSEPASVQFTSPLFSKATIFNAMVAVTVVFTPYILGYRSQGFWTRLERVREQPIIRFKYEALVILEMRSANDTTEDFVWTTFPGLNSLNANKVSPFIMSREGDENMDGINEYLDLEIQFTLPRDQIVAGLHYMLLFDYRLHKHATFHMESMVYGNYQFMKSTNRFEVTGDLSLVQREPLYNRVRDGRFNKEVIPRNSTTIKDYNIRSILGKYTQRNVSTILSNKYDLWTTDVNLERGEFAFGAKILYPEQSYECWAGLWTVLKWAWIQYFSLFVLVALIVKKFQKTVYKSRLFETRVKVPWKNT